MPAEDSLASYTGYSSVGAADSETYSSGPPLQPPLAFVHDPYSFRAYDLVVVSPSPSSVTLCSSSASDQTSVGSHSVASDDASSLQTTSHSPPLDSVTGMVGGLPHPHRGGSCVDRSSSLCDLPSPSPKHRKQVGNASAPAPPRVPPLQWRRYGTAVSHIQALKGLQGFNLRHPPPPPSPIPFAVWVGPPSPTAPAALPRAKQPARSPTSSTLPSSTPRRVSRREHPAYTHLATAPAAGLRVC
eukprot:GGOE01033590.1.p1 GENE.GGOE01033590.1~~GGOE01033590.1.p1  ORF type:complete len:255 (+),score=23.12 GGOE01033590.1:37-765(+)